MTSGSNQRKCGVNSEFAYICLFRELIQILWVIKGGGVALTQKRGVWNIGNTCTQWTCCCLMASQGDEGEEAQGHICHLPDPTYILGEALKYYEIFTLHPAQYDDRMQCLAVQCKAAQCSATQLSAVQSCIVDRE